jgi:hypothetical protein
MIRRKFFRSIAGALGLLGMGGVAKAASRTDAEIIRLSAGHLVPIWTPEEEIKWRQYTPKQPEWALDAEPMAFREFVAKVEIVEPEGGWRSVAGHPVRTVSLPKRGRTLRSTVEICDWNHPERLPDSPFQVVQCTTRKTTK